jgi:hypothetical protein
MPRRKNSGSFTPGTNRKSGPFTDPEIRARAIATRLANPHGKRGAHRYEDLPGVWTDHDRTTIGEKIGSKEKAALAQLSFTRLENLHSTLFDTLGLVLHGIQTRQLAGQPLTMNDVQFLGKMLDKVSPDLRAEVGAGSSKTTRIVIGAPLGRLLDNGGMLAAEIREEQDNGRGDDRVPSQPERPEDSQFPGEG